MKKPMTLVLIESGNRVLLGRKKRGFGAKLWNGFGGKVHTGETIEQAARREVKEECGLEVKKLDPKGLLIFYGVLEGIEIEMSIYCCTDFSGQIVETEEMVPRWFEINKLPFDIMWPDDRYWMPLLLENKKFSFWFRFNETQDKVLDYKLEAI